MVPAVGGLDSQQEHTHVCVVKGRPSQKSEHQLSRASPPIMRSQKELGGPSFSDVSMEPFLQYSNSDAPNLFFLSPPSTPGVVAVFCGYFCVAVLFYWPMGSKRWLKGGSLAACPPPSLSLAASPGETLSVPGSSCCPSDLLWFQCPLGDSSL